MNPNLAQSYRDMWSRWTDVHGRTSVANFWLVTLANAVLYMLAFAAAVLVERFAFARVLILVAVAVYTVAAFVPFVAMVIRRLHDSNRSGWFALTVVIPIVLVVLLALPGSSGPNRFGAPQPPSVPVAASGVVRAGIGFALAAVIIFVIGQIAGVGTSHVQLLNMVVVGLVVALYGWFRMRSGRTRTS